MRSGSLGVLGRTRSGWHRRALSGAGGWLARAARVLDQYGENDCAERGYLLQPLARAHYAAGRYAGALEVAQSAADAGRRHADRDLVAVAMHSQGRALLRLGGLDEGFALLDEVFVETFPVGLTSPVWTGIVACSVVEGCQQIGAFDRAAEWTAALSAWCEEQPQLVQFSAECLVHRRRSCSAGGAGTTHWSRLARPPGVLR